uniref:Uncharacterized protein n=2 Tax=Anguilla anguilla TaxID=7936 RepID=A0A0E9T5H2_ANGAN
MENLVTVMFMFFCTQISRLLKVAFQMHINFCKN